MKIYRIAQFQTIGPVYHGTPYGLKRIEDMQGDVKFFTDNQTFARDYGSQKSFERKMDADITVLSAYLKGVIFDPQNEQNVNSVIPFLPEKITVYNDFGMDAKITKEKWRSLISGVCVNQPLFSEQDLQGKKVGDTLPDNEVYDKPTKYEILKITPDMVWYAYLGGINSVIDGVYAWRWEDKEILKKYSREEVANDIINLGRIDFMKKYKDFERKHDIYVMKASRHPITTYNNDVWRWLEGDGVFEAIQKAGFNIIKSREKGNTTYAVLPSAEIIPIPQISKKEQK